MPFDSKMIILPRQARDKHRENSSKRVVALPCRTLLPSQARRWVGGMGLEPLPTGWERRETETGQAYYVNHVTQTTQWLRPTGVSERENECVSQ
jgi:hypothetical protein